MYNFKIYNYNRVKFFYGGNLMFDSVKEECGVFGVYSKKPEKLAYMTCVGLSGLQHRGEESCRNCSKYRWNNILS